MTDLMLVALKASIQVLALLKRLATYPSLLSLLSTLQTAMKFTLVPALALVGAAVSANAQSGSERMH